MSRETHIEGSPASRTARNLARSVMRRLAMATLLFPLLLGAQKFYHDDPLEKEPAPMHVGDAAFRKLNDYFDLFSNTFAEPGERHPDKDHGDVIPARAVNTLGEVPDSAWFTNRIGTRPMSVEEVVAGAGHDNAPSMDGQWRITGAKTEGVSPGFRIVDSRGRRYLLKFDPLDHSEMATAADVVGSRLFHALGYNVPENYLVVFDEDKLILGDDVMVTDASGEKRPMSSRDVTTALLRVPRQADGRIRGVASFFLPGKILGEFRYDGTRSDDPNDIVPHEHRRDLRGLFVFCAWLNHSDSRAINSLDSLVEENGRKFIRHYLIDFGAIMGSASVTSNSARDGNAYFWELKPALAQIFSLGIYVPRWARARYKKHPALGMIEFPSFEPRSWKPNYPSAAFQNRLPDDTYWAAKKVMAFRDEHIQAVVKLAQYSDQRAEDWLIKYLIRRRDRIGEVYLGHELALDGFRVENQRLGFENLAVKYGFRKTPDYKIEWTRFDNEADSHSPLPGRGGLELPEAVKNAAAGSYFAAKIQAQDPSKSVTVYLRRENTGLKVVGIGRTW